MIYAIIKLKSHQRELGSSLPNKGGVVSMKFLKKLLVLVKFLKLIIDLYRFFN